MKISEYTAVTVSKLTDVLLGNQDGVTRKFPLSVIVTYLSNVFQSKLPEPTSQNDVLVASGSPIAWCKYSEDEFKSAFSIGQYDGEWT